MPPSPPPLLVAPAEVVTYSVVGDRYAFKVTGAQTGGAYSLFEGWIPPGSGSPPHVHRREDEGFQILEGELIFYLGHERRRVVARAGDFVHAPRDVPHFFRNEGTVPVKTWTLIVPAGLEQFFAEVGDRLASPDAPPVPFTPDQVQRMLAVAPRYGLEIFGPPPRD